MTSPSCRPPRAGGSDGEGGGPGSGAGARAGVLAFLATVLGAGAAVLVLRGLTVAGTLPSTRVETYVELLVLAVGVLVAARVALSAAVGCACVLVGRAGGRWRGGERIVRRHGPGVVQRLARVGVTATVGAGLVLGGGAAHAHTPDDAPTLDAPASVAVDLGWQVTTQSTVAPDGGASGGRTGGQDTGEAGPDVTSGAGDATPATPRDDRAQHASGSGAAPGDAPGGAGRTGADPATGSSGASAPGGRGVPPLPATGADATAAPSSGTSEHAAGDGAPHAGEREARVPTGPSASVETAASRDGSTATSTSASTGTSTGTAGGAEASTASAATAATAPGAESSPGARHVDDEEEHVVVLRGDTLWAIAERTLPPGAGPAQIAVASQRWYEANRLVIGDDPDLIHPGQILTPPA